MSAQRAIVLNPRDNVATALAALKAGERMELMLSDRTRSVTLVSNVPFGHKFSLSQIAPESPLIKYGEVIGIATTMIQPGDYVHVHNVASARGRGDLERSNQ
jgi:altronate dehydratase small subunit